MWLWLGQCSHAHKDSVDHSRPAAFVMPSYLVALNTFQRVFWKFRALLHVRQQGKVKKKKKDQISAVLTTPASSEFRNRTYNLSSLHLQSPLTAEHHHILKSSLCPITGLDLCAPKEAWLLAVPGGLQKQNARAFRRSGSSSMKPPSRLGPGGKHTLSVWEQV